MKTLRSLLLLILLPACAHPAHRVAVAVNTPNMHSKQTASRSIAHYEHHRGTLTLARPLR